MLGRPEAGDYFPDLELRDGRIVKVEETHVTPMETKDSTEPLQLYFNPTLDEVEDAEVLAAAKFMHWTINHPEVKSLQVKHMIDTARRLVTQSDKRLGLDGLGGDLCCVVMDVRHQGRAGFSDLQAALNASDPFKALLKVGEDGEPQRVKDLRAALSTRRELLSKKKWSRSKGDFV
jgi:hypothetical protein